MVMEMFRLSADEDVERPEEDSEDEVDETEDEDSAEGTDDSEDGDEEEDTTEPGVVTQAKYDADMKAMRQMINDLKATAGRAQSAASRIDSGRGTEEVRAELRAQSKQTADLLATIVTALDPTVVDPKVLAQVKQAQADIQRAAERDELKAELMKEAGIVPGQGRAAQALQMAESRAAALESELIDQIEAFGLDPDDADVFDWTEIKAPLIEGFRNGTFEEALREVKREVNRRIREATQASLAETRRETRRKAAGPAARGTGPKGTKEPLRDGDLADKAAALRELLR